MGARISRYTYTISAACLALAAAVYATVLVLLRMKLETAAVAVSDFGEAVVVLLAAVIVIRTALSFGKGEPVRRYWILIGHAVAVFAVGDLVWSYIEVIQGQETFPSVADIFYVGQYLFFGLGIIMAALAYRRMMDVRVPFAAAAGVSVVLLGVLYKFLLAGILADTETDLLGKLLSLFYPVADVFLALLPALFIAFVAWRLGRGSFGWPWWPIALGLVALAASDAGFAYLDWNELYYAGHPVDAGWMFGMTLIAVGALVARDVFGAKAVPAAAQREAA